MAERVKHVDVSPLDEVLAHLHFAFRTVVEEPDALLAQRGLGRVHHRILFFVSKNPGIRVGELLAVLGVTKQALHRPLRELVEAGLLASRAEADNRRVRALRVTRSGAALEDRLSGLQRTRFAAAFAAAGPSAERHFRAVLRALGGDRTATLPGALPRS